MVQPQPSTEKVLLARNSGDKLLFRLTACDKFQTLATASERSQEN